MCLRLQQDARKGKCDILHAKGISYYKERALRIHSLGRVMFTTIEGYPFCEERNSRIYSLAQHSKVDAGTPVALIPVEKWCRFGVSCVLANCDTSFYS